MKKTKLILSAALIAAMSLTVVSATGNVNTNNTEQSTEISTEQKSEKGQKITDEQKAEISKKITEKLAEKLEAGEITQEKYEEIIASIESGDFQGKWGNRGKWGYRGNAEGITDEQKAEISKKITEKLAEKLEAGEITQEKYDEIVAAIESGEFRGNMGNPGNRGARGNWEKAGELTEEQKAKIAEKRAEMAEKGGFGHFRGKCDNTEEVTE